MNRTKLERLAKKESEINIDEIFLVVKNNSNNEYLMVCELDYIDDENFEIVSQFLNGKLITR
jgi:hypothetical protein